MGYTGKGRKPFERASHISHAQIIANPQVEEYLNRCSIPCPPDGANVDRRLSALTPSVDRTIKTIIAIDGGYTETFVRDEFPSATITFFTFGPLMFNLADLRELDESVFIAPEDLVRLKNLQRFSLALPTKNVSLQGKTLSLSIRQTLHEFLSTSTGDDPPLVDALQWLLFEMWNPRPDAQWTLPGCPNIGCERGSIVLTCDTAFESTCTACGGPIYLVDAMRLHERIDEEHGAAGIAAYVMNALEQLVLVHLIRAVFSMKRQLLPEILFIKDGPLAYFGVTAPLRKPMRELAAFLNGATKMGVGQRPLLNVVGLEKSGPFVDHAAAIDDRLAPNSVLLLDNEYIYRFIVPGDVDSVEQFGHNTYWGSKLIFKSADGRVYVATLAALPHTTLSVESYPNISGILETVAALKCSMYDNALIPVALANKLVSISDYPSSKILANFARDRMT